MHTGSPHSSSSEALRQRPGDCERTESLRDVDHSPRAAQRAGVVERGAGEHMVRWSERACVARAESDDKCFAKCVTRPGAKLDDSEKV